MSDELIDPLYKEATAFVQAVVDTFPEKARKIVPRLTQKEAEDLRDFTEVLIKDVGMLIIGVIEGRFRQILKKGGYEI